MNSISHLMCSVAIRCVCVYQTASGLMRFYPTCKYVPTCSEYMILVLRKYGFARGVVLGLWRILRCNPFSRGGLDMP